MTGRAECHVWASSVTELVRWRLHRLLLKRALRARLLLPSAWTLNWDSLTRFLIGIGCHYIEGDGYIVFFEFSSSIIVTESNTDDQLLTMIHVHGPNSCTWVSTRLAACCPTTSEQNNTKNQKIPPNSFVDLFSRVCCIFLFIFFALAHPSLAYPGLLIAPNHHDEDCACLILLKKKLKYKIYLTILKRVNSCRPCVRACVRAVCRCPHDPQQPSPRSVQM